MKSNVNKIILLGNLGADPELRQTAKGVSVVTLSIATNREYKTANGEVKKETFWHRATVWGRRAETTAHYLRKGSRVYIEGLLQQKKWTDKDGNAHKGTEILVNEIKFMGGEKPEESTPVTPLSLAQTA